jgi:hypothetical protein
MGKGVLYVAAPVLWSKISTGPSWYAGPDFDFLYSSTTSPGGTTAPLPGAVTVSKVLCRKKMFTGVTLISKLLGAPASIITTSVTAGETLAAKLLSPK